MPKRISFLCSAAILSFGLGLLAYNLWGNISFVHDDAFIALRYARNFVEGHGLVWNPGEYVEGYTSFLGVAFVSALGFIGIDYLMAARLVNLTSMVGIAGFVYWFLGRNDRVGNPILRAASAALILGHYHLSVWVMGGLEAPLFAAALTLGCALMAEVLEAEEPRVQHAWAALVLGLVALVRPDGAWFGAIAGVFYCIRFIRPASFRVREFAIFALAGLLLPSILLAWRYGYYGEFVPITVIAKTVGIPESMQNTGWAYLKRFVMAAPYTTLPALLLLPLGLRRPGRRMALAFLVAAAVGYAGLVVYAGGDHMPALRLLAPLQPLIVLILAYSLGSLEPKPAVVLGVVFLALAALLVHPMRVKPRLSDPAAFVGTIVGDYLREHYAKGTLVALNTAGTTPYFAKDLRFIDMLGLNDPAIAKREIDKVRLKWQRVPGHAKGDGKYVLSRHPDLIIIGPAEGVTAKYPWFLSDLEISESPEFHSDYMLEQVDIDVTGYPEYEKHRATQSGIMKFTYYSRVETPKTESRLTCLH